MTLRNILNRIDYQIEWSMPTHPSRTILAPIKMKIYVPRYVLIPWICCYLAYNFTNSIYRDINILDGDTFRIWLIIRGILRESWAQLCEKQKKAFEQEKSDVRREICRQKGFQSFCRFQESSIFCIHKWIEESPTSSQEMEKCLPFIFVLNQDFLEIKNYFSISFTYRRKTSFAFLLRREE